ncbi:MAG: efflux RND transporter periplasmic adaptor subunit [Acidobacteriota bacterium]|nr:efflux RND transporter periplasmic adaptor subunit [Acidobacteriota bacterium]
MKRNKSILNFDRNSSRHRPRVRGFFCGRKQLVRWLGIVALVGAPLLLLSGCAHSGASPEPQASKAPASGASYFTVGQAQMSHLRLVSAESSNLPNILRLPGTVDYNGFETTPVITQVSGPVTRVLVLPGQMVRKGQPLLEVTSPDYAVMRDNYIKARDSYNLAHINYSRAQDLYTHSAISTSALEQAQSAEVQAQADMTAARQALRVIGLSNLNQVVLDSESPEIPLLAPINGEVVERTVAPGQVIQGGATQCFVISNMNTVWVLANVYQNDLAYVHLGDEVSIQTNAYPTIFPGRISYLAPAMDPNSRTLQVRIVTENPGQELKKDMFVTVVVNAGTIKNALTVPDAAVLRNSENQPFVYALAGPDQFAQRLVTIGASEGGRTHILSGLSAGEQVVADGSLFLQFANSLQH